MHDSLHGVVEPSSAFALSASLTSSENSSINVPKRHSIPTRLCLAKKSSLPRRNSIPIASTVSTSRETDALDQIAESCQKPLKALIIEYPSVLERCLSKVRRLNDEFNSRRV